MPNDHTAAAWLMSLEPALARLAAEARAEAELHQAHVLEWLSCESCEICLTALRADQLVRVGRSGYQCPECYMKNEPAPEEQDHGQSFGEMYAALVRGPM